MKETVRYLRTFFHYYKKEIAFSTLEALAKALLPLLQLYFTARMIDFVLKKDYAQLPIWAIYATLAIFFSQMIQAITRNIMKKILEQNHIKYHHILARKYRQMDVKTAEDEKLIGRYSVMKQNKGSSGFGIDFLLYKWDELIQGMTLMAGSLALTLSFFRQKVTIADYQYLNHGWLNLTVIGLCLGLSLLCLFIIHWMEKEWLKTREERNLGNRMAQHFLFRFPFQSYRYLDSRIYRQDRVLLHSNQSNPYFKGNIFEKYVNTIVARAEATCTALRHIQVILIYLLVGVKAYAGAFSIGYFTQYIGGISQFVTGFGILCTFLIELKANIPYAKEAMDFLDIRSDMYTGTLTTEKRTDRKYELEFRNVSFRYPGTENFVLKNLNLKFEIGKRLAIVGQNGSGKTTFIKLLLRFYDPEEGEILLNGIDIRKYKYEDYLKIFSVVFQDFKLLAYPVGQNIAGSMHYDLEKLEDCMEAVGLTEKIAGWEKGLDTYLYTDVEEDGIEISGGEAQKIAIARALYRDAAFIILDEPTAALDPIAEAEIYERLGDIVSDRSAIFISHRLSSCKFADRILVFDEGRIVQIGSHSELYQSGGKYQELWDAQAGYYQE